MKCKLCQQFYKDYPPQNGEHILYKEKNFTSSMQEIKCAFPDGTFNKDNWNCQTMARLKEIVEEHGYTNRHQDTSIGVIPIPKEPLFLIMSWYKDRGRIDAVYVLDEDEVANLTLDTAEKIIKHWRNEKKDNS